MTKERLEERMRERMRETRGCGKVERASKTERVTGRDKEKLYQWHFYYIVSV